MLLGPIGVSLAVALVPLILQRILLPGLDAEALAFLDTPAKAAGVSVGAMGIAPLLSAFVLVEVVALIVPPWRALRVGGFAGRAKLDRAVLLLGASLALVQAFLISLNLEAFAHEPGLGFKAITTLTLLTATMLLARLAGIVDQHGLGGGYPVLLAGASASVLFGQGRDVLFGDGLAGFVPWALVVTSASALVLLVGPRAERRAADAEPTLPIPGAGVIPLQVAATLAMMPWWLGGLFDVSIPDTFTPGETSYELTYYALLLGSAAGLTWLFNRPAAVRERLVSAGRGEMTAALEARRMLVAQLSRSVVVVGAISLIRSVAGDRGAIVELVGVVVLAAVAGDLWEEHRARRQHPNLVPVWMDPRPYAAAIALDSLRRAGITAYARSLRFRTLLQFFGPQAPIVIWAPIEVSAEAGRLCQTGVSAGPGSG